VYIYWEITDKQANWWVSRSIYRLASRSLFAGESARRKKSMT
jgi:hypothetical protein